MRTLIDTSFLLAAMFNRDTNHQAARQAMQNLRGEHIRLVPAPIVFELFYMLVTRTNYNRAVTVFEMIQSSAFEIVDLTGEDMQRMAQIMHQYASAEFDLADVSLMAVAERLNITQIYTFDRRDFTFFRPEHCAALELLP